MIWSDAIYIEGVETERFIEIDVLLTYIVMLSLIANQTKMDIWISNNSQKNVYVMCLKMVHQEATPTYSLLIVHAWHRIVDSPILNNKQNSTPDVYLHLTVAPVYRFTCLWYIFVYQSNLLLHFTVDVFTFICLYLLYLYFFSVIGFV